MTNNPWVGQEVLDIRFSHARHGMKIESSKGATEVLTFPQNRDPTEPGLETLERQFLEQPDIVAHRLSPFGVVIGDVLNVVAAPPTPWRALWVDVQPIVRSGHLQALFSALALLIASIADALVVHHVPGQTDPFHHTDHHVSAVNFPPFVTLARHPRIRMMIVVPAFAECQEGN